MSWGQGLKAPDRAPTPTAEIILCNLLTETWDQLGQTLQEQLDLKSTVKNRKRKNGAPNHIPGRRKSPHLRPKNRTTGGHRCARVCRPEELRYEQLMDTSNTLQTICRGWSILPIWTKIRITNMGTLLVNWGTHLVQYHSGD
jgi:hypothetical protein